MWNHLEMRLIHLLSIALAVIDTMFRVHWGERLLSRWTDRWQMRLSRLEEEVARLEAERDRVRSQSQALALNAAAVYLGGRSLLHGELRFNPADPREEEILDATVNLLVKSRLAAISPQETDPGHYLYYLEPDWPAIRAHLAQAAQQSEPQVADWFGESVKFIDDTFLSGGQ
jgi:hypothetical protein